LSGQMPWRFMVLLKLFTLSAYQPPKYFLKICVQCYVLFQCTSKVLVLLCKSTSFFVNLLLIPQLLFFLRILFYFFLFSNVGVSSKIACLIARFGVVHPHHYC
jgi:hypothetical protein